LVVQVKRQALHAIAARSLDVGCHRFLGYGKVNESTIGKGNEFEVLDILTMGRNFTFSVLSLREFIVIIFDEVMVRAVRVEGIHGLTFPVG
jgi:hypothetical protein